MAIAGFARGARRHGAIRGYPARIRSTEECEIVESVRAPVRLGHSVFTSGEFDRKTLRDATAAFREFRNIMDARGVTAYRAVTTSAAREARNGHVLIERIRHQAKIDLEVISGEEEARLVRVAVLRALRDFDPPRFILDLGGGSLELNELRRGVLPADYVFRGGDSSPQARRQGVRG